MQVKMMRIRHAVHVVQGAAKGAGTRRARSKLPMAKGLEGALPEEGTKGLGVLRRERKGHQKKTSNCAVSTDQIGVKGVHVEDARETQRRRR